MTLPESMKGKRAFFVQPGPNNKERAREDGDILIYPFDHKFEDNFGFYRLNIILERRDGSETDDDGKDANVE